jgi:hypothetical protein
MERRSKAGNRYSELEVHLREYQYLWPKP